MIYLTKLFKRRYRRLGIWLLTAIFSSIVMNVDAQGGKKKVPVHRSISSSMPSGYSQVGATDLCYNKGVTSYNGSFHSIDIQGKFETNYYGSTFSDCGYDVAIQVGNNTATYLDCQSGSTVNGVRFEAEVVAQAELARICYYLTNTNNEDVTISLGIHADVMIGNNDSAPIVRKLDTVGNTYGLALLDGNGAQLCVLFGAGLPGVTGVSDFWFGRWSSNSSASNMVGNYEQDSNWMVENGSYDSGMGWCWKNRTIPAGATVIFSWLIGVGDVKLEPNSSFEVTPEDPEGWNDLTRLHVLSLEGDYESPAGLSGKIEYAVEDSETWITLTDTLESGSTFTGEVRAMFNPELSTHTIRFRTVDQVGNTTLLPSIVYPDVAYHTVSGIMDKTYTGDSIFQTELTCNLSSDQYTTKNYHNNVHAGTASFNFEGVFPYTIGRKTYTFTINPQTLTGELALADTNFVYTGYTITPDWQFTNANYANLQSGSDYSASWTNNRLPGTGTLTVTGKGNYTGSLSANINIDKAQLRNNLFTLTLPDEDITYDEQSHGASISTSNGVGQPTITYQKQGETEVSTVQPTEAGDYTIYLAFADGSLYYGREKAEVGQFTIYEFNEEEWITLQSVLAQLTEMGWSQPWDISLGMKGVSLLHGITIEKGHITALDLSGLELTGQFPRAVLDLPQLQSLNLANNRLNGNLGQYASSMSGITSLDVSGNNFNEVMPMLPTTLTNVNLGNQTIDGIINLPLADLTSSYLADNVPNILLYNHALQTYSPNIRLLLTTADGYWGTRLVSQNGTVTLTAATTDNAYKGQSGDTLNVALLLDNGTREGSTFKMKLSFEQGDGNFDGQVNVLDLQTTLNYMFEEYATKPYNYTAANLWEDNIINVQDAVSLVNLLLDVNAVSASRNNTAKRVTERPSEASASVTIENGYLKIYSIVPVSAFDIMVSTNQQTEIESALKQMGFTCTSKWDGSNLHLVGYSLNGAEIPAGETAICALSSGIVSYAMLANREANEISVSQNGGTTTYIQSSVLNPSTQEVYRIPLGSKRAIIIDTTGRKTIIKDEK